MKLLYFTDPHMRGTTPANRTDVYYIALLKKFWEIGRVIKDENIDFVFIGGDMFDTPTISNRLLNLVADAIRKWGVKVFVVPGNHDIFGQSIASLEHTSLGILNSTGVVKIITRDNSPLLLGKRTEPNNLISVTGQEYYEGIDTGINNDYEIKLSNSTAFNLLIAHGFVVRKPFHPSVHHTLVKDIQSSADLILTGHYHPESFDDVTASGTKLLKPTSFGRLEATEHNINHKPQYLLLEIENSKLKHYEFVDVACAADGHDIFNEDANAEKKEIQASISSFTNAIENVDLSQQKNVYDMLREIASNTPDVTMEHQLQAIKLLTAAEKTIADAELNGYIPDSSMIHITEIVIEGYQSHDKTVIKLAPGALNAFVGPSHNGKTAAIRAINWCLYNDPNGTEFMRDGAKYTLVTLKFSNGRWLTRRRTKSDSGTYTIYDEITQQSQEYSKFTNAIPVEVFNATQMPKVDLGGKKKVSLNYAEQLEGPFMLSMSNSERATAIGTITKTNIVDESVASISKEIINLQKGIKSTEAAIEEKENIIKTYDYLPTLESEINEVTSILETVETLQQSVNVLSSLEAQYGSVCNSLSKVEWELSHYANLDAVESTIEDIERSIDWYLLYDNYESTYIDVLKGIEDCNKVLKDAEHLDSIPELLESVDQLLTEYIELNTLHQSYSDVVVELNKIDLSIYDGLDQVKNIVHTLDNEVQELILLEDLYNSYNKICNAIELIDNEIASISTCDGVEELEQLLEDYKKIEELDRQYNLCITGIDNLNKEIEKYDNNAETLLAQYKELLKQLGTCPVCGNRLTDVDKVTL